MVTDLLITGMTFVTKAAPRYKRYRDIIARPPFSHRVANGFNCACEFVSRHMRQRNIGIVPDPAVPVTSANTGGFDPNHHAMRLGVGSGTVCSIGGDRNDSYITAFISKPSS